MILEMYTHSSFKSTRGHFVFTEEENRTIPRGVIHTEPVLIVPSKFRVHSLLIDRH